MSLYDPMRRGGRRNAGTENKKRDAAARRVLSLAFALVMLLQTGAVTRTANAVDADPVTGTIPFFRWDKCDNFSDYYRKQSGWQYVLLTWSDNGLKYYFRTAKGNSSKRASYKNVGPYTNDATYELKNALVSTQPTLNAALSGNCQTFFTTEIDASFAYYFSGSSNYKDMDLAFGGTIADGQNQGCIYLEYSTWTRGLVTPASDDGNGLWFCTAAGNGIRFSSYVKMKDKEHPSYSADYGTNLKHSGSQISSSTSTGSDTVFDKPYVGTVCTNVSAIQNDFTVDNGMVTALNNAGTYLAKGKTVTVKNGGVLSIDGLFLNDGRIVVEKGGLLLLKEGATLMPYSREDDACGGIVSSGSVIVRKNAKLVGGGTNGVYFGGGGVVNFGLIAGENFRVLNSHLIENRTGAVVYAGKTLSWAQSFNCMAASLDRKTPVATSAISESGLTTFSSRGVVLLESEAVINKGGTLKTYEGYGSADDPVIKVYAKAPGEANWTSVVQGLKSELGYYRTQPSYVTGTEGLELIGFFDELRAYYEDNASIRDQYATYEDFRAYYLETNMKDYDTKILVVYDGIFAINGEERARIPWYWDVQVYQDGKVQTLNGKDVNKPYDTPTLWEGSGTRPDTASDNFANAPLLGKVFELEPLCAPGKRAEVAGGGTNTGDNVRIWGAQKDAFHMKWRLEQGDVHWINGEMVYYYYLVSVNSNMAITLTGTPPAVGQNTRQDTKRALENARAQLWRVESAGNGLYRLIPRSDDTMALAVNNGADVNGSNIQVERRANDNAQKWNMIATVETKYVNRVFELEPLNAPAMRMEVVNGTTYYGYNVQLGATNGQNYQRWRFEKAELVHENGEAHYYYFLNPIHWRHLLGVTTSPPKDGTNVNQSQRSTAASRQWRIIENADGSCSLVPRGNQALRLNVQDAGTTAGTNVNVATDNGTDAMKWNLIQIG